MTHSKYKYSIIIPTLNEEETIGLLLNDLLRQSEGNDGNIEIIVCDGGSTDKTTIICNESNVKLIKSIKGRGNQLMAGANYAKGEYLIFLHADSFLTSNFFDYLDGNIPSDFEIATFRMKLDGNKMLYKIYSFFTRFDSKFSTFGDQCIVVCRKFYNKIGGFSNIPIMEDVDFLIRARNQTKILKFNKEMLVSARRFRKYGIIKTQIKSTFLIIKYLLGADPQSLYSQYYQPINGKETSNNSFYKISGIRKSQNKVSFNNK